MPRELRWCNMGPARTAATVGVATGVRTRTERKRL